MGGTGVVTDVLRAAEELRGIVAGIACDYEISDAEIGKLVEWLHDHAHLLHRQPFKELNDMLNRILQDQVIEEDEREELLEWCQQFSSPDSYPISSVTDGIRRLHGFLQGIAMDGQVTESEVMDLADWLRDYEHIRDYWPFDDVWELVERILEDGKVTRSERQELLLFCRQFLEYPIDRDVTHDKPDASREPWMLSGAPILATLESVCEKDAEITVKGRSFCFTGHVSYGKRRDLQDIVTQLGGSVSKSVTRDLDYLVVGALSQPCWAYSTYGRKIEAVVKNRKKGSSTKIIHEQAFLDAVKREADST